MITRSFFRAMGLAMMWLPITQVGAQSAIEDVIVEVYYVSDENDATDEAGGGLQAGSRTYRVYLDLCDGCALRAVYGDANHELRVASTAPFFNHVDRGRTYGHLIQNGALDEGTAALDSWLAMGAASNQRRGVVKAEDTDGSIVGGANNDGGSAGVPGGLLVNADPLAGIPLTEQDGLLPLAAGTTAVPPNFNVSGDDPASVFNDATVADLFSSLDTRMACSVPGVVGATSSNRVLVAQLTTMGELSFCLNVEVQTPDGSVLKFVCSDDVLLPGETPNGLLVYPPQCGCTDPNFLEYDPTAGCDDGSCQTAIVFGCLDTTACNYDPDANFNVPQLCCYGPGNCNGLDISLVCPTVGVQEGTAGVVLSVFPNPANDILRVRAGRALQDASYALMDATGRSVRQGSWTNVGENAAYTIDLNGLSDGLYHLHVRSGEGRFSTVVVKGR
jgi:hypothetical protein